jgi:predicted ATPase with chaperone activity
MKSGRTLQMDSTCQALMKTTIRRLHLTAQAYHRVLNMSGTTGDLAWAKAITQAHVPDELDFFLE